MEENFDRYLIEWKTRKVSTIKRSHVQVLVNKLGKEIGKTTANRTLQLLKAVINKGIKWSIVDCENPASGITMYKLKPRKRFLAEYEIPKLLNAIQEEENTDIKDYVYLSLYTGVRRMNILSMRWEHVDLEEAVWHIPDTKNNEPQDILLTDPELEILKRKVYAHSAREAERQARMLAHKKMFGESGNFDDTEPPGSNVISFDKAKKKQFLPKGIEF